MDTLQQNKALQDHVKSSIFIKNSASYYKRKNKLLYLSLGLILGFVIAVSINSIYAYTLLTPTNSYVNTQIINKIQQKGIIDKFDTLNSTSTFNNIADYETAKREYDYQQKVLNRLDRIISILSNAK